MVFDVGQGEFEERVISRSREVPVVVDFWAGWCAPCRALGPALERAAVAREGRVDLAKVDVDRNQQLAQAFGVQGIPAVKAFREGRVAAEFTGAVAPAEVERFFDRIVPSDRQLAADAAIEAGDEDALRAATESDPGNPRVAAALARILLSRGEDQAALSLVEAFETDFMTAGLAARARLSLADDEPGAAFDSWDAGDHAGALEDLQAALASAGEERREELRRVMIAIFTELGPEHQLAREHRRRLSAALY